MKRLVRIVVCGVFLAGHTTWAEEPGDVVARVGDRAILAEEVGTQARRMGLDGIADEAQRQRALATVLEQLVDERAVRSELARLGIAVEPSAVEAMIDRLRQQVAAQGKDFAAVLAQSGQSLAALREQAGFELAVQAYVRPRITNDALNRVFQQHQRELDGTRLRVSHVVLRPDGGGGEAAMEKLLKQAEEIRQEIVQGRLSFAEAAARWSAGPSRREGGDLGWISRDGPMVESFSSVVYKLAKGGLSEPFATPTGVHVATVTAVEPGRTGPTAVRNRLERLLAAELVRGLVVEGRRTAGVTFAAGVPHLDPATLGDPNDRRPVVCRDKAQ
jgi:parvulin-like peptidyl-prolyl isomerase